MEGRKCHESTVWLDIKIVIYAVSTFLGYLAHIYFKFPRDAPQIACCLAAYAVFMAIHYYIETYKEKGSFFILGSHEMTKFEKWQKMQWSSETVIADDQTGACYELKVSAWSLTGAEVSVSHKYPVE